MADNPGTPQPNSWMDRIDAAFCAHLADHLHDGTLREKLGEQVERLTGKVEHLVRNRMDAANVHFAVLAAAGAAVLEPELGRETAAALVSDGLNGPFRKDVLEGTRAMLDAAEDSFAAVVAASRGREEEWFGPSFGFLRPLDDEHTYVLDVRRCLFHEALAALGRPDLQEILCRFDLNWADAVDPERHGVAFVRPITYASGDVCRMVFSRVERPRNRGGRRQP